MRVIVDFVINHSSREHPWFQAAAASPRSPWRDWYVWLYAQTWEAEFDDSDIEPIRIEESELTVGDVMTPEVVAVAADAPVAEIARTMLDQHIHRVFVREGDAVVGLVSTTDLLGLLAGPDQE